MGAIVVYESFWGNTAEVARAIAEGLGEGARALSTDEATAEVVASADTIVVGAPLLGFSLSTDDMRRNIAQDVKAPSKADTAHPSLRSWLDTLPAGHGRYAAFETGFRLSPGSAVKTIVRGLEAAGYRAAARPERFRVGGMYGPMKAGEIERARAWGAKLVAGAR